MKYKCIVLEKIGKDKFRELKKIKFNPEEHTIIRYKDKEQSIPLTTDMYCYEDKKTVYIFWNITDNNIISFTEKPLLIDSKFLDKFLTTSKIGIIGQLLNAVHLGTMKKETNWSAMKPVLFIIIGGVIGYLIRGGV